MGKKNNESIKADRSKKEIQTNVSRRNLLKLAGATAAGATALAIIPGSSLLLQTVKAEVQESPIKKWAMVVDLRRCIGCQACFAACKSENGVPLGIEYTWVETHEEGDRKSVV